MILTDLERIFGAATLRGEAEGEGDHGMELVAWVIRNRMERPRWPSSLVEVVLDDLDFSFWNGDSKRRAAMLVDRSDDHWNAVRILVLVFFADTWDDPTHGADHYFNPALANPSWRSQMTETLLYKNHLFLDSRSPS